MHAMISVNDALELVLQATQTLPVRDVPLREALGLVLGSPATADRDSPSADKSLVDGYAVIADDVARGVTEFRLLERILAGMTPQIPLQPGTASQIMTGAPIPAGATAVVMVEQTERTDGQETMRLRQLPAGITYGQNIMRRGASMQAGQRVLEPGHVLRPIEIGLLAEIGCARVPVIGRPRTAILSTGNELVDVTADPPPGCLRNSNGPMLWAMAQSAGAVVENLGIARDDESELVPRIAAGLAHDVLVISGGVSAGVADLVPSVLASQGVQQIFHKVRMKPGKPLWFGVREAPGQRTLVFGLPGNPVSSLVSFELFVRPALRKLAGVPAQGIATSAARLAAPFVHRGDRPTFFPAQLSPAVDVPAGSASAGSLPAGHVPEVRLLDWRGSADLRTLTQANALVCFPAGNQEHAAHATVAVYRWGSAMERCG